MKERKGTSVSLLDGNKQSLDFPEKPDGKESDANWLRNRARKTCFRLSENLPEAVETSDEFNYEGTPTVYQEITSGQPRLKFGETIYQTVVGLIPIKKAGLHNKE